MRTKWSWNSSIVLYLSMKQHGCETSWLLGDPGARSIWDQEALGSGSSPARKLCFVLFCFVLPSLFCFGPLRYLWCFIFSVSAPAGEMQSSLFGGKEPYTLWVTGELTCPWSLIGISSRKWGLQILAIWLVQTTLSWLVAIQPPWLVSEVVTVSSM